MEISDCQDTDARYTTRNFSKSGVFSMPTPTEEIKPVILVSYNFGFGGEKKMFSLEAFDYRDTDAREKNNDSSIEYSSTSVLFSIDILMEEIQLLVTQK